MEKEARLKLDKGVKLCVCFEQDSKDTSGSYLTVLGSKDVEAVCLGVSCCDFESCSKQLVLMDCSGVSSSWVQSFWVQRC